MTRDHWNRPDETRDAFCEGWLKTGDLAVIDSEGYVTIVDRKKDMIITGGEKVYSTEVENVLYEHPNVLECAAFGVPDERWGESVRAAVVLRRGAKASPGELADHCRGRLASLKRPRAFEFVAGLPRTGTRRVLKTRLRDPYRAGMQHG